MKILLLITFIFLSACSHKTYSNSDFERWKNQFAKKAAKKGLNKTFVLNQLKNVKYREDVIKKDRNQITSNTDIDYNTWIQKWLRDNPSRIELARKNIEENRELLEKIEKTYKVEKEIIVSLWGVETFFGKITGDYQLVEALATLAYDKRRRSFFEKELHEALRIIAQGHTTKEKLLGSWAGATGQCQFMPSNVLRYAVDFDKDGKKDIWNTKADVFASIANYLKKHGWKYGKEIGVLVKGVDSQKYSLTRYRSPRELNRIGVRKWNGKKLKGNWKRKIASVPFQNSPYILRGSNYKVIMKWNRSSLFAALNLKIVEGLK